MKRLEFFMPMIPPTVTAQEAKLHVVKGRPFKYDPPELVAARMKLMAHLAGHLPTEPFGKGPLRLVTKWCWPCEGTKHVDGEYYTNKPDTHNVVKMPVDVMQELGFFVNDAHIASETIEKFWAKVPGIYVFIEELPANGRRSA